MGCGPRELAITGTMEKDENIIAANSEVAEVIAVPILQLGPQVQKQNACKTCR